MIKVMIVEDEAPIGRSIKSAVESSHERFEVIALAYNGQEALKLLNDMQPDIIITDIRMPIMDGLTLTEKVREMYPHIQIILLSGYQEFDYARKAMLLGVKHYLLKPASRSQIKELLDAIYLETLGKKKNLHRQYVASLIQGKSLSVFPFLQSDRYGSHMLILCCAGPIPSFSIDDDIPGKVYWEQHDLESMMSEEINGDGEITAVNGKSDSEQILMISYFRNREIMHSPREWADLIADRLGSKMPVSMVYSEYYADMQKTASIAQVFRSHLYKNIIFGVPVRFSMSERIHPSAADPEPDPLLERKLAFALEQKNSEVFKKEIKQMFEKWKHMMLRQIYVEKNVKRLLELLLQKTGSASYYSSEMLELDVNRIIMQSTDYAGLYRYTCRIIDFLFLFQNTVFGDEKGNESIAIQIEEYLKEHFAEQINHQVLSDKFGLVPSYVSKVFNKYKGISPAKYIVKLRIEKAKELLLEYPERLAKDIADIVGYPDPNYFSRIFKRETGLYPSEFREQNGVT
jgi:two-component system response regulator YesN